MGQDLNTQTIASLQMGGIGEVNMDLRQFSLSNPAILSRIRMTSYTLGVHAGSVRQHTLESEQSSASFIPTYLAIAFPFGRRMGMSFGVRQSTKVAYEFQRGKTKVDGSHTHQGLGGISDVFLGLGIRLSKNINIGFEGAYRFGEMIHLNTFRREGIQFQTRLRQAINAKGWQFKYALNTQVLLSKNGISFISSVVLKHAMDVKLSQENLFEKGTFYGPESEVIVKTYDAINHSGTYKMPLNTTIGVALTKPFKWNVGATYRFANAREVLGGVWSVGQSDFNYTPSHRFSMGASYTVNPNTVTGYWKIINYRIGGFYEQLGKKIRGTPLSSYGFSLGAGLPIGRQRLSHLDIGFSYEHTKTAVTLPKEDRFMVTLAISFAGKWFIKRKIQ